MPCPYRFFPGLSVWLPAVWQPNSLLHCQDFSPAPVSVAGGASVSSAKDLTCTPLALFYPRVLSGILMFAVLVSLSPPKHPVFSQAWFYTPFIPARGRQRKAELCWVWGQSGLHSECQDSRGMKKDTISKKYLCMDVSRAYMPVHRECAVPLETRRGHQIPWDWSCRALWGRHVDETPVLWESIQCF